MRTIEHITRDDDQIDISNTLTIGTISSLIQTDQLNDAVLFEASCPIDADSNNFQSKAISWNVLYSKIQQQTFDYFDSQYIAARTKILSKYFNDVSEDTPKTVYNFLYKVEYDEKEMLHDIDETPHVWNDVYSLAVNALKQDTLINGLEDRIIMLEKTNLAFASDCDFKTNLSIFQVKGSTRTPINQPTSLAEAYENSNSGLDTGFVLAIYGRNQVSTTYKCDKTGILCLYGWLDTTNIGNRIYLPDAWCALEGYIEGRWEIIGISSVIPNKQLVYASFTVPVKEGLQIRVRIGFIPGEASGRYPYSDVPESLSNRTANAFVGGIYSVKTNSQEEDETTNETSGLARSTTKPVIQNTYNIVKQEVDLSEYVSKKEIKDYIPKDFYPKAKTLTKTQISKALDYHIQKSDVIPEVSFETKKKSPHGNDDKPVNRIAVWNILKRCEEPIGTVIYSAVVPSEKTDETGIRFMPDHEEWALCDGSSFKAKEYPELSKLIIDKKAKGVCLPTIESTSGVYAYIKVKSSLDACKTSGWSIDMLRSEGVDVDEQPKKTWKDNLGLS